MKFTMQSLKRSIRTFAQAVIGYFSVNLVVIDFTNEKSALKSALIGLCASAVAAGIAAVMNLEKSEGVSNDNGQLG